MVSTENIFKSLVEIPTSRFHYSSVTNDVIDEDVLFEVMKIFTDFSYQKYN